MLLSIISVNYNDALGLSKTIGSVQHQDFIDYEHILIDGGSIDGSKELIESNKEHFAYWVSEPDAGIYDAMNKGIAQAKGDYILFLNSGDILYKDDVLSKVTPTLDLGEEIVYGNLWIEDEQGRGFTNTYPDTIDFSFLKKTSLGHASTFINKALFEKYGMYRTDLTIVSDWAFFVKVFSAENVSHKHIDLTIAHFYEGGISTSPENREIQKQERRKILLEHFEALDESFDAVFDENTSLHARYALIAPEIEVVATNKLTMSMVNMLIKFLAFILKKKRS